MDIKSLVAEIKKSKKYSGLGEEIIEAEIKNLEKKNPRLGEYKSEFILKQIKAKLHEAYGSFQTYKKNKIEGFLKSKDYEGVMKINLSTKERLESYKELYEKIFAITGKPQKILDIGCGLNPLGIVYSGLDLGNIEYHAYDINENDMKIIKEFFAFEGIKGKAEILDARSTEKLKNVESADLCFMFKVLDPIEKSEKNHLLGEEIIKILGDKCSFIVASFATKTLSGRLMNHPYRGWIERMLDRIGFKYAIIQTSNEIYYVISKK